MYVVVIGLGAVGRHIVRVLEAERMDIAVVDIDPRVVAEIAEHHDVMTLVGYGARNDILEQAGVARADLVVAVTNHDEVNLIAALAARNMGAKQVIARVQEEVWGRQDNGVSYGFLGVDVVINPQVLLAAEIAKIAQSHGASHVIELANDRVELVQMELKEESRMLHKPLSKLALPPCTLIAAIVRNGELFVPGGADVMEPGDRVYLLGKTGQMQAAEDQFTRRREAKKVCIVGGGVVGLALAEQLGRQGAEVLILEKNRARAEEIAAELREATVVCADGTDLNSLTEERMEDYDLFVAASHEDEVNLMAALLAKNAGASRTLSIVHRPDYQDIYKQLGVDVVLSPRLVAADHILRHTRQKNLKSLTVLEDGQAEVLEFTPEPGCRALAGPIHRLNIPRGALVAAIVKGHDTVIAGGDDLIGPDDTVIVLTTTGARNGVSRLFKKRAL